MGDGLCSDVFEQCVWQGLSCEHWACGAEGAELSGRGFGAGLHGDDGVKAACGAGRSSCHQAAGLLGVAAVEDFLSALQWGVGMDQVGAAFQGAAKLAAGHDFLAGVAAFFEVHAADRFIVEHLRHKCFVHGLADQGHATHDVGPRPDVTGDVCAHGQGGACRGHPQGARNTGVAQDRRVQRDGVGALGHDRLPGWGVGQNGVGAVAQQAAQLPLRGGVGHFDFGAQHKHGQAFEGLRQQVLRHDQQHGVWRCFDEHKARLHAAFGRAKSGQARLANGQQQDVVAQLVVQEVGGVFALCLDDAQMGQGGLALELVGQCGINRCGDCVGHGVFVWPALGGAMPEL